MFLKENIRAVGEFHSKQNDPSPPPSPSLPLPPPFLTLFPSHVMVTLNIKRPFTGTHFWKGLLIVNADILHWALKYPYSSSFSLSQYLIFLQLIFFIFVYSLLLFVFCFFSEEALSKKIMRRGRKLFNEKPGEVSTWWNVMYGLWVGGVHLARNEGLL